MTDSGGQRTIPVIVDDRECAGIVPEVLAGAGGFDVRIARLKTGDYKVDGRFLFERKTLPDFAASVISGRLFRQALKLVNKADVYPVLLLEGIADDLNGTGVSREALQGALITVSLFMGLPVLRSRSPEETVHTFRCVAGQGRVKAVGTLKRPGYRSKGKTALQGHLLQGFPGIGPERAKKLLKRFGTVRAVMNAKEEELEGVEGIGADTARGINRLLEEPRGVYRCRGDRLAARKAEAG